MWENPESFRAFLYMGIEFLKVCSESERLETRLFIDFWYFSDDSWGMVQFNVDVKGVSPGFLKV